MQKAELQRLAPEGKAGTFWGKEGKKESIRGDRPPSEKGKHRAETRP